MWWWGLAPKLRQLQAAEHVRATAGLSIRDALRSEARSAARGARPEENFEGCGGLDAISIKSLTHTLGTTRPTHRPSLKWQRSAPTQRRAPRVLSSGALRARCSVCGSTTASSAAPAGISSEFTASYLRLRSSLSCLIVRPCSHVRRSYLGYRHHILQV